MELTNEQFLISGVKFLAALVVIGIIGAYFYHRWMD